MIGERIQKREYLNLDSYLHSDKSWRLVTRLCLPMSFRVSVRLNTRLYIRMYWMLRRDIQ